ncbi:amino acid permease [bacterium]|nr:amino acid permease [bacterium]
MPDRVEKQRLKFSTFGGVFTPSILTILGAIMFMRAGFVIGQAGVMGALAILLFSTGITLLTSLSISAISTNLQVRGGGAYFLISRVLGPESGGAIGIVLFIAQALSVPFYILGFTEALVSSVPALEPHSLAVALAAAGLLFVVAYIGASWSIRVQFIIMAVLGISILAFMGGAAVLFKAGLFGANSTPGYTLMPGDAGTAGLRYSFWSVFAIYFPAVTGILAGVNMSGDLKDPMRSIPRGTLLAVVVGFLVYGIQIVLCGGAFDRTELIARPFEVLRDNALWGTGVLVVAGVIAATLSSALGSYLGAPRILQAVGKDRLIGFLYPFARGEGREDEPRRALTLTGMITLLVIVWAAQMPGGNGFNVVAALITMFFLITYGMLNLAAFTEAFGKNPSFRPRFRAFHWITALLGAAGCTAAALLISPIPFVAAAAIVIALYWYLRRRQLSTTFGDARRGYVYSRVRSHLLQLRQLDEDPRNWRPTILVFSGNPATREELVAYAVWLESGRGIVQMVNIIKASPRDGLSHHRRALAQLRAFCRKNEIHAFPLVLVAENVSDGIASILQTAAIGPIRPNLALFGWNPGGDGSVAEHLETAAQLGMSQVLVRGQGLSMSEGAKRIDVWWRGRENGALMLLLAHLLSRNWEWADARIRLLRVVPREEGQIPARNALRDLVESARFDAEIVVPVCAEPFIDILHRYSTEAACVFLGMLLPAADKRAQWQAHLDEMLEGLPTTILVHSSGSEGLLT